MFISQEEFEKIFVCEKSKEGGDILERTYDGNKTEELKITNVNI